MEYILDNNNNKMRFSEGSIILIILIVFSSAHHLTVKKLAFRPSRTKLELASCGDDHLVRIYKLQF